MLLSRPPGPRSMGIFLRSRWILLMTRTCTCTARSFRLCVESALSYTSPLTTKFPLCRCDVSHEQCWSLLRLPRAETLVISPLDQEVLFYHHLLADLAAYTPVRPPACAPLASSLLRL